MPLCVFEHMTLSQITNLKSQPTCGLVPAASSVVYVNHFASATIAKKVTLDD